MATHFYLKSTAFYRALAEFESGNNDKAVGAAGEVSAFQIMPATWRSIAGEHVPLTKYNIERRTVALSVARQHVNLMIKSFREEVGRLPSPGEVYAMYNCGYAAFKKKNWTIEKLPKKVRDKVDRFLNLLEVKAKEL